jgi:hypothetical protein
MMESDKTDIFASIELTSDGFIITKRGTLRHVTQSARAAAVMMEALAQIEEHLEKESKLS